MNARERGESNAAKTTVRGSSERQVCSEVGPTKRFYFWLG